MFRRLKRIAASRNEEFAVEQNITSKQAVNGSGKVVGRKIDAAPVAVAPNIEQQLNVTQESTKEHS